MKNPTPLQIDNLVRRINKLAEDQKPTPRQQRAAKRAADLRAIALALTLEFGAVPSSAPSSKRLNGAEYQLTATTGTVTTEHPEAIVELRDAMRASKQDALFAQLFTPSTRYDRAKDALNNLKNAELPAKLRTLFDSIFARTSSEKPRAAFLRIDPIK